VDQKHRSNQYNFPEWRACRAVPEEQHKEKLLHAQFVARCLMQPKEFHANSVPLPVTPTTLSTLRNVASSTVRPPTSTLVQPPSFSTESNALAIQRLNGNYELITSSKRVGDAKRYRRCGWSR